MAIEKTAHGKQWVSSGPQTSLTQPCLLNSSLVELLCLPLAPDLHLCSHGHTLEVLSHSDNFQGPARSHC